MKYLHYFETAEEFIQEKNNNYIEPWGSYTEGRGVDYNINYSRIPFTIVALGIGNITWSLGDKTVQYSKNYGSWETMDSSTTISVVQGDEIQFKGTNSNYYGNRISSTGRFNVLGNVMSLTNGNNFETVNTTNNNCFRELFKNCSYVVSAKNLKLPATELGDYCYYDMFYNCSRLTDAPELPATTLSQSCYAQMFYGCTALAASPELPATTLANACYYCMFYSCTKIRTAPVLRATEMRVQCYYGMFQNCAILTTPPELPSTSLATACYGYMFSGCSSLTTAPELPSTTLATYCYQSMFQSCKKLNYVKAMFINLSPANATSSWLYNVASTGTFVKNSAATWTSTGDSGVPTGWTVQTATA